jgi:hypothetical protein
MRIAIPCKDYLGRIRCAGQTRLRWIEVVNFYADTLAASGKTDALIAHLEHCQ